jgi:hypothetical protein
MIIQSQYQLKLRIYDSVFCVGYAYPFGKVYNWFTTIYCSKQTLK